MSQSNKTSQEVKLPDVRGKYKLNASLAHLSWFKVGGNADILFKPEDSEDISSFLKQNINQLPVIVLGAGSNIIIRDQGVEGVVVKLGRNFTNIEILSDNKLSVGGKKICSTSLKFGFNIFCQLELDLIMPRNGVTT